MCCSNNNECRGDDVPIVYFIVSYLRSGGDQNDSNRL